MTTNLVTLNQVRKFYGPEAVLAGVTMELRAGEKVGLVGPNGAGKTTLLRIIAGYEEADGGQFWRRNDLRIGYLPQQPQFQSQRTVWAEAMEGLRPLVAMADEAEELARQIASEEDQQRRERLAHRYDLLQQQLQQLDGYQLDYRVQMVLEGLGFVSGSFQQPAAQLSGGQQNRLLLAQLLLAAPDLLLLDEPSNHLDVETTEWLESFLAASRQALLIVSHDRYLLDKVTEYTVELFDGTVERYRGNFSAYWAQKAQRLEVQRREFEKQQTAIEKMEDFVRRHHAGQKHAQAEDRRKKLARMERVDRPRQIEAPPMALPEVPRSGDIVLRVEGLSKAFDRPLFRDLRFQVERGERWGIFGRNGTGKTTLLRCILGQVAPDEGSVAWGTGVVVGYSDQQLQELDPDLPAMDAIAGERPELDEPARRHLLARFGITGDMAFQAVRSLSGGERSRVALARLALQRANLLVLDEPTNHLDLWARDALESALRDYSGSVLLVSHDRFFLNRVVDHMLVLGADRHWIVPGNYDAYVAQATGQTAGQRHGGSDGDGSDSGRRGGGTSAASRKEKKRGVPSGTRKRRFPYRKLEDIEHDIMEREAAIEQLQLQLSAPDVVRDPARIKAIQADIARGQEELAMLYEHWEEAAELNA